MRHQLRTQVEIDATPEEVWRHLVDLSAYSGWNPYIPSATGTVAVGERLRLRMEPPGRRAMTFRPTVTEAAPARTLEWLGRLGLPGIFDGRHRFDLVPIGSGTLVIQSEHFSGLLVRVLRRSLDGPTRAGFEAMNAALARRVGDGRAAA